MEGVKTWLLELIGGMILFISGLGVNYLRKTNSEIKDVETRVNKKITSIEDKQSLFENEVRRELSDLKMQIVVNAERDKAYQESMKLSLKAIMEDLKTIKDTQEKHKKDRENFYYKNPELKKPDA